MSKILIIPDIHGREFWKDCLNYKGEIVFLGDYLDPYDFEFDSDGEYQTTLDGRLVRYNRMPNRKEYAIKNFEEIIKFAKNNDKVTLLLGNHDYHYIVSHLNASRKDTYRYPEINKLFLKNRGLFKDFYVKDKLLLTHAGVTNEWVNSNFNSDDIYEVLYSTPIAKRFQISSYRGGHDNYSGPLWEDVHELEGFNRDTLYTDEDIKYQIFGHTMQVNKGSIYEVIDGACVDSRDIFEVDTENPKDTLKVWNRNE